MNWHLGLLVSLLVVSTSHLTDAKTRHMKDFIKAVEGIEADNPGVSMLDMVKGLRKAAGFETSLAKYYLGDLSVTHGIKMNQFATAYIREVINHRVLNGKEEGVVLTLDGSNVALAPMLLGIEAGLQSTTKRKVQGLYHLTLTDNLVASLVHHAHYEKFTVPLGTKGYWDSIKYPRVYMLEDLPSLATDAVITGGIDGLILGSEVAKSTQEVSLSSLLKSYYSYGEGLDGAPRLISQNRRKNFKEIVSFSLLRSQMARSLTVHQQSGNVKLDAVLDEGFKKFHHIYAVCPKIITRSMWGAAPYIGTPTQVSWPLPYLFIHHTYQPSRPCTTYDMCVADMRSMQRYHQETNGWADIGYSFVAGGEGNLYEGRGWTWVGAHTAGYNSKGYGVCFVGDFTSSLPILASINLVRYDFANCAVDAGRLSTSYNLYGHRQAGGTECPGNTLYKEIQTWEHYESYLP